MLFFNWLHNYSPQPILVKIGWLEIHWYGFLIALGAILAFVVVLKLGQKYGLKKEKIYDLAIIRSKNFLRKNWNMGGEVFFLRVSHSCFVDDHSYRLLYFYGYYLA